MIKRPRKRTITLTAKFVPVPPERVFAQRRALEFLASKLIEMMEKEETASESAIMEVSQV